MWTTTTIPDSDLSPTSSSLISSTVSQAVARSKLDKQDDWSRYAIEGLQDFLHVLSSNGRIRFVSDSCEVVVGYKRGQLLGKHINAFIHPDDVEVWTREFGEAMLYGRPMRFTYRFRHASNDWIIMESQCNVYQLGKPDHVLHHRELVVMARPYRNTSGALFDSFLEQKVVGERLMQQLEQLKREEREELEAEIHHPLPTRPIDGLSFDASVHTRQTGDHQVVHQVEAVISCPVPMHYLFDGNGVSTVHLPKAMEDFEPEKSDNMQIGELGIPFNRGAQEVGENSVGHRAYKKRKMKDPHICQSCGTLESPEWRKGPEGRKTLCNACGLRWSKFQRVGNRKAADAISMASNNTNRDSGYEGSHDPLS